jgi:LPXTG-motif cell wall-anchored protein
VRTTRSTSRTTRTPRRTQTATILAALSLAVPVSGLFGGTALAASGGPSAHASDRAATAAEKPAGFIGPVAPAIKWKGNDTAVAPYTNAGGVTVGANTTSYETVADGKGSTFTGVGGGQPSGDITKPQPLSNADQNNTGANDTSASNPYKSTRNGDPSLNGNGGGQQVGQPCAACVGKADNKNPHGQRPGPSDRNAGYECDRNNGIGKTNPAHTGCKPGTPPCVDQPGKPCTPPPGCVPSAANNYCNPPVTCVPTAANNYCNPPVVCVPTAANNYCGPPPPVIQCPEGSVLGPNGECIYGEEEVLCPNGSVMPPSGKCEKKRPPTVRGQEAFRPRPSAAVNQPQAGVLPATGASNGLGLLTGAGFVLLAVGAGAMLRRRTD